MTEERIQIIINEKGELIVESHGIQGPKCIDEIHKLLEDIALSVELEKTDEYYMGGDVTIQKKVDVRRELK